MNAVKETRSANKRRYIRFPADPLDYAQIDFEAGAEGFEPKMVGLIVDEAPMGGCAIIVNVTDRLQVGSVCRIKVGRLAPLAAQVQWRRVLDEDVIRIGLQFLE